MTRNKKNPPQRNALSKALSDELSGASASAPNVAASQAAPELKPGEVLVSQNETNLVHQFIKDCIAALPPAQQAVMKSQFDTFMPRCVVLAPPTAK